MFTKDAIMFMDEAIRDTCEIKPRSALEKLHNIRLTMLAVNLDKIRAKDKEDMVNLINAAGYTLCESLGVPYGPNFTHIAVTTMTMKEIRNVFKRVLAFIEVSFISDTLAKGQEMPSNILTVVTRTKDAARSLLKFLSVPRLAETLGTYRLKNAGIATGRITFAVFFDAVKENFVGSYKDTSIFNKIYKSDEEKDVKAGDAILKNLIIYNTAWIGDIEYKSEKHHGATLSRDPAPWNLKSKRKRTNIHNVFLLFKDDHVDVGEKMKEDKEWLKADYMGNVPVIKDKLRGLIIKRHNIEC